MTLRRHGHNATLKPGEATMGAVLSGVVTIDAVHYRGTETDLWNWIDCAVRTRMVLGARVVVKR